MSTGRSRRKSERTLLVHFRGRSKPRRSRPPPGNRSQIARRRLTSTAGLIPFLSMPPALNGSQPASRPSFWRDPGDACGSQEDRKAKGRETGSSDEGSGRSHPRPQETGNQAGQQQRHAARKIEHPKRGGAKLGGRRVSDQRRQQPLGHAHV